MKSIKSWFRWILFINPIVLSVLIPILLLFLSGRKYHWNLLIQQEST